MLFVGWLGIWLRYVIESLSVHVRGYLGIERGLMGGIISSHDLLCAFAVNEFSEKLMLVDNIVAHGIGEI